MDVALENKVPIVMVSTDKAVNPSNVMGASKRIAEMYVAGKAKPTSTQIITTRFGNVLGSNGLVNNFQRTNRKRRPSRYSS